MRYNIYEWRIKPTSSFITELQSDTIWGHIIWAVNYLYGEEEVERIIKESEEYNAPFIVSNGFLSDYFPMINDKIINIPNSLKLVQKRVEAYRKKERESSTSNLNKLGIYLDNDFKKSKMIYNLSKEKIDSIDYVSLEVFNELRIDTNKQKVFQEVSKDERCPVTLKKLSKEVQRNKKVADFLEDEDEYLKQYNLKKYNDFIEKKMEQKNSINRMTNSTNSEDEASLYTIEETYYNRDISIFIKLREDFDINKFEKALDFIESMGFGKKASSGKGSFIKVFFKEVNDLFKMPYGGNGFIILSNYIPKKGDYEDVVHSKIVTKRGKVSGGYASRNNIFKKTFVCFAEGSIFKGKPLNDKGTLLRGLNYDKKIVQFGISFVLGVNIDE